MKLYIVPGACSLAVHIALREAEIPCELARVELQTGKADDGTDYRSVNPKGYVPALLLDDGQVLTETAALLQFVSDQNPRAELAPPAGTPERYRLLEWLAFINSEIHKGFSPLFSADAGEEVKDYARLHLAKRLSYLQGVVCRRYLLGDHFTVADAYLFTVLGWMPEVGMDIARWAGLERYRARIALRPHVVAARQAEA